MSGAANRLIILLSVATPRLCLFSLGTLTCAACSKSALKLLFRSSVSLEVARDMPFDFFALGGIVCQVRLVTPR